MMSLSSKKIDLDFCNYIGNMCVVPLYFGKSIRIKYSNFNKFQISLKHTKTTSCFQFFFLDKNCQHFLLSILFIEERE